MSIQRQIEILNGIVSAMHASAEPGYSSMRCEFEYESNGRNWSAGATFSYHLKGTNVSKCLKDDAVYELLHDLHEAMKAHSGGDWKGLLVEVGKDGKATTKFDYQGAVLHP